MKTITKKYEVFNYDELSDSAKERVRNFFGENDADIETDMLEEDFKYYVEEKYPYYSGLKFQWSLGHCQGDGLSFSAQINLSKYLDANANNKGSKAFNLKTSVYDAVCNFVWGLHSTGNTNMYCYASKSHIEWDYNYQDGIERIRIEKLVNQIIEEISSEYMDICRELEEIGYKAYENLYSDEYAKETCEANEYTFLEDGTMFNV